MPESGVNRRDFMFGVAGAAGGAWLAAHASELRAVAEYTASDAPQQPWEFFTPDEAREFDAVSAQIVPTDDTPGAREARVVRFTDRWFATMQKEAQPVFRNDFKLLGDAVATMTPSNRSFAALNDAEQVALLTAFEKSHPVSFGHFRGAVMQAMFSDPIHGGNFNKVGWQLQGFQDRYSWAPPFGFYDRV